MTCFIIGIISAITACVFHRLKANPKRVASGRRYLPLLVYVCIVSAIILLLTFAVLIRLDPDNAQSTIAIAQVIAAAGVALAALAALWSIKVNRPLALRAVEKHSEDLNRFLASWAEQFKSIRLKPYKMPMKAEYIDIIYNIEQNPLFRDLSNHLPSEITLLQDWQQFHDSFVKYEEVCTGLWTRIEKKLEQSTQLRYELGLSDEVGCFCSNFVKAVYEDSLLLAEKKPQRWLEMLSQAVRIGPPGYTPDVFWLWIGGDALVCTSTESGARQALDVLKFTLDNLNKSGVDEKEYVEQARNIYELKENADSLKKGVLNTLNELQLIAIFPGDCEHLGRTRK